MSDVSDLEIGWSVILKTGGVTHDRLVKLHTLLDETAKTDRLRGRTSSEIPHLLNSKWSQGRGSYLIEIEIPIGSSKNRPRSFIDQLFDAIGIFPDM